MKKKAQHSLWRAMAASAIVLLPLGFLPGCNGSSGGSSGTDSSPTGFGVEIGPETRTFESARLLISLTAVGFEGVEPTIYYTKNLASPTVKSRVYTGPFNINKTTVIKAVAINPDATLSDVAVAGFVFADNPFRKEWAESGHGNIAADAFRHWDEDGEVSESCARCHSAGGLMDYAADGVIDHPGELAMGHDCDTCHAPVPLTLYNLVDNYPYVGNVVFPSLESKSLHDASNLCLACHQGRESALSVDEDIAANPDGPFTFVNVHYYAAGANFFGGEAHGGYEYPEMEYAGRNAFSSHESDQQTCIGCHLRGDLKDHRMDPVVSDCTGCHTGTSFESLSGSPSANYSAIEATHAQLLGVMQAYANSVLGFPIAYDAHSYPYFVHDLNNDGVANEDEAGYGNRYDQFDQRLLRASYNYQVAAKDPAGYIHNGTYIRQLVFDAIRNLGAQPVVSAPGREGFILASANKSEQWHASGHADSTAEAFRHWDGEEGVSASCARCHTSSGFVDYIEDGHMSAPGLPGQTIGCSACHNSTNLFADSSTRYDQPYAHEMVSVVKFPSGAEASMGDASNLCLSCHQGRASGLSINSASPNSTEQSPDDYDSFNFINRHYYAAGAIMFGSDVTAAYEYAGKKYVGLNSFSGHGGEKDTCLSCHMRGAANHNFKPKVSDCRECHVGIKKFEDLGLTDGAENVDYDGDGIGESFDAEIAGSAASLYDAIQTYATKTLPQASPIVYSSGAYPYFFKDTNGDRKVSPGEAIYPNAYKDFDRELLRAAYNYHSAQDPGGDIHNYRYVLQSVYDSADMLDNGELDGSAVGQRP